MNPNELHRAARREWRETRAWWTNEANFGPILPPHIAERLRAPLYALGIALACITLAPLLHVEINVRGTAIGLLLLLLATWLYRLVDAACRAAESRSQRPALADERPQPATPATGETIRLSEVRHD